MATEFVGDPSWVWGLASRDDDVRAQALERHRALVERARQALHWSNDVWRRAGSPAPREPHLAAELDQAQAAFRYHLGQTIFELVGSLHDDDPELRERHAPFVLLYLVWEGRYPDDWRAPDNNLWSPWGRKESVLRALGERGVPEAIRPQLTDLLADVVRRPYRCKDWRYAGLVRHIADDRFHQRMHALLDDDDPVVRLRARFLLDVAAHPEAGVTRVRWQRWLDADPGRVRGPGDVDG
ncbi:hypothetical protein LZG04_00670 [Saccharothrix sp. S26]|uniref:hypothetical protein n=1 Tax=Saccharothrix sp. S26 TaxID=2907215 RepID=UPI001F18F73D|nr:hypothetical protein [Saccharothrix sp. S26]MCE6993327.1 hypothetical protein [Saccharothrix sp. S26]